MKKQERIMIITFITPLVLIYSIFFLYPTIRTGYISLFTLTTLSGKTGLDNFVGIQNYINLLQNQQFIHSYVNILKILFFGGIAVFVVSLFFATILTGNMRGRKFWRSIIYLPNIITPVALVIMWTQYIFNNKFGMLHNFFSMLGLKKLADIPWTSVELSFTAMLIGFAFCSVGYYMLLYMAAMEQIPVDYYEYASLEGAPKFYVFRRITFPLLKETTRTALIFWGIGSVNFFLWSRVFNADPMTPSTLVPASYMFQIAFGTTSTLGGSALRVGEGAAIGVMLSLTVVVMFWLINLIIGKEKYEF